MNTLTFSEARDSLKTVMDTICKDHTPTVISRVNGGHVVMMSLADFNSMKETMYLLSSPDNANHLMESIAQLKQVSPSHESLSAMKNQKSKNKQ